MLYGLVALGHPASAGTIAHSRAPDTLLDGGPTHPCAAGADYAAGVDVQGRAVPPADIATPPVPVPDGIAVPLHGGRGRGHDDSPYVQMNGHALAPLLNPPPCR